MKRLFVLVMFLLIILLMAVLVFDVARGASDTATVQVLPGTVNRYDTYQVVVIGPVNTSFVLDLYGPNSYHFEARNVTDAAGVWRLTQAAAYDFGTYSFVLQIGNQTARADLTVGCDARCQALLIQDNGAAQQKILYALVTQYGTYVLVAVIAFETVRAVAYFSRQAREAGRTGQYTVREALLGPFARFRNHINPGDNVTDPRNPQNPRIAADQRRRLLMDQLHDATGERYREWRPKGIDDLRRIFRDLDAVWRVQLTIQPDGIPWARAYAPSPVAAANGGEVMSDDEMESYGKQLKRDQAGATTTRAFTTTWATGRSAAGHARPSRHRALAWTVYLFGAVGVLVAALVAAAYGGVTVAPLAALWVPFPPDPWKFALGLVAACVAFLVYVDRRTSVPKSA